MSRPERLAETGVTLVEVMVALAILSTVLIALGGLMFQAARHTRQSAAVAYRSAASTAAAAWAQAVPWDSIERSVGCTDDTIGQFTYSRCVTVDTPATARKRISVTISPTGNLTAQPDTVVVNRNKPRFRSTLNVN